MRKLSLYILLTIAACQSFSAFSQTAEVDTLRFETYMDIVRNNHPMIRQTDLLEQRGDAVVLKARGGFDPELVADLSQKYFDDKRYYQLWTAGLKVPTNLGVEFYGGFEDNSGVFLNPENNVPNNGLWYAGIKVPLGQGLVFDKRRAELKRAQLYRESTEVEQVLKVNDLLYEAGIAYWDWLESYHRVKILEEAVNLSDVRLEGIRQSAQFGDRASIDTLEAGIQLNNRLVMLQKERIEYGKKEAIMVSNLWIAGVLPLELKPGTVPSTVESLIVSQSSLRLDANLEQMIEAHPKLRLYDFKLGTLEVDRRIKAEYIKPEIDLKFNAISSPVDGEVFRGYNSEDYTLGLDFKFPVFLRKDRGNLRLSKIKISEVEFERRNMEAELLAKARGAINESIIALDQAETYSRIVVDYERLFRGEENLFQSGESSLFMVNSRETGLVDSRIKSLRARIDYLRAILKSEFALGILR